jgi:geranylgeranyl transferase type-1 subunit beta
MLGSPYPVSVEGSRRYLLEVTQHPIGGFGKFAGTPPDIHHSYLGLAVLAVFGDADLKDFDVGLCCSKETTGKIEKAREGLLKATEGEDQTAWTSDGFWAS